MQPAPLEGDTTQFNLMIKPRMTSAGLMRGIFAGFVTGRDAAALPLAGGSNPHFRVTANLLDTWAR